MQLGLSNKTIRRHLKMGYIDAEKVEDPRGFRYEISACEHPEIRNLLTRNMDTLADHPPELALHVMERRGQCDVQYSKEAADYLSVGRIMMHGLVNRGEVNVVQIGRCIRFRQRIWKSLLNQG